MQFAINNDSHNDIIFIKTIYPIIIGMIYECPLQRYARASFSSFNQYKKKFAIMIIIPTHEL
jgi:hypothetical protein